MKRSKGTLLVALTAVTALTLGAGLLQGRWTNRWAVPPELLAAAKRLQMLPEQIGPWKMQATELQATESQYAASSPALAGASSDVAGVASRTYQHEESGQTVKVAVIVGPPGPVSVQIPTFNYSSRDYHVLRDAKRVDVRPGQFAHEAFWSVVLRSRDVEAETLHVAYAWNNGDGWSAPAQPRLTFGGQPLLYKLQLAAKPLAADVSGIAESDPCLEFLKDFLPAFDPLLAASLPD